MASKLVLVYGLAVLLFGRGALIATAQGKTFY